LFIPPAKTQLSNNYTEKEIERFTQQELYWFTQSLSYIQLSENPLSSTSNQNQITTHNTKRWFWIPQSSLILFATLHTLGQNNLCLYRISTTPTVKEELLQVSRQGLKTPEFTQYKKLLWSELVTTTKLEQQSCTLKNSFKKQISFFDLKFVSILVVLLTSLLLWKRGYIYSTWNVVV